jgi:hypothetical protein
VCLVLNAVSLGSLTCGVRAGGAWQDPTVVMSVLMKLAGGTPSLAHELNVDAFLEQARSYDQATSSPMGWMLRNAQVGCPANHRPRTPVCTAQLLLRSRVHTRSYSCKKPSGCDAQQNIL